MFLLFRFVIAIFFLLPERWKSGRKDTYIYYIIQEKLQKSIAQAGKPHILLSILRTRDWAVKKFYGVRLAERQINACVLFAAMFLKIAFGILMQLLRNMCCFVFFGVFAILSMLYSIWG